MVKIIDINDEEFGRECIEDLKPFYEMTKEESEIEIQDAITTIEIDLNTITRKED